MRGPQGGQSFPQRFNFPAAHRLFHSLRVTSPAIAAGFPQGVPGFAGVIHRVFHCGSGGRGADRRPRGVRPIPSGRGDGDAGRRPREDGAPEAAPAGWMPQ